MWSVSVQQFLSLQLFILVPIHPIKICICSNQILVVSTKIWLQLFTQCKIQIFRFLLNCKFNFYFSETLQLLITLKCEIKYCLLLLPISKQSILKLECVCQLQKLQYEGSTFNAFKLNSSEIKILKNPIAFDQKM